MTVPMFLIVLAWCVVTGIVWAVAGDRDEQDLRRTRWMGVADECRPADVLELRSRAAGLEDEEAA